MSTYDKLIKQATKPKPGAPKPKYIDPIIASSFSQDGSLQDICRALGGRLREPSSLVVFKSLIVLHTMIRNGGIDNVLSHLASDQGSLKLKNVVQGGNWQGQDAPRTMSNYAAYIDERIRAYRDLRHDVIRSGDSARTRGGADATTHRLRRLTVEKGLLREVAISQRVCSRLLDCAFFLDNLNDDMTLTAFRMTLKDLLAIYSAINEGVINLLEHYFEMSKVDAERALDIYKRFCRHTEKVVAYLSGSKKASYSLNVPIPSLKHAPISLAGALQEYLEDPNFEKNRQEYKENKRIADGGAPAPKKDAVPASDSKKSITIKEPTAEEKTKPVKPPTENQAIQDFFQSIETEQMSMFGGGPAQQQQMQYLSGQMAPMPTGMGMMQPQMTGYNPFFGMGDASGSQMMMAPQQTGFMPQQTGFGGGGGVAMGGGGFGYLQSQPTGFNPFRQSMMVQPQATGFGSSSPFGQMLPPGLDQQQQQQQQQPQQQQPQQPQQTGVPSSSSASSALNSFNSAFGGPASSSASPAGGAPAQAPPSRAASAPIKSQKTGSRNPFAPPPGQTPPPSPPPPQPRGPSLFELAMGRSGPTAGGGGNYGLGAGAWDGTDPTRKPSDQQQQQQPSQGLVPQKTGLIGSIASEFTSVGAQNSQQQQSSLPSAGQGQLQDQAQGQNQGQTNGLQSSFGALSLGENRPAPAPLQAQPTGFAGSSVQPFKPTSSFGASLAASGPFSQPTSPAPVAPNMTGNPFALSNGAPSSAQNGASTNGLSSQPTGFHSLSSNGASTGGLASQPTGFGSSLFASSSSSSSGPGATSPGLTAQPTGFAGSSIKPFQPTSAFGSAAFGQQSSGQPQQQQPQQQQQSATTFGTLI
ncbi:ANTH-domain-containing protein [Acaromyces ingoldii]|uniref:ANTH-domain-containing protein n=1 Tax=Acaromyces ingoldii TaxID=215250 RepID=A0A316YMC1_9BASI|nr:ANTH-domain-containing protein [Acaromyces ingoldii]PWN90690.1 ANTH-domain-containing protein [Acaromyces ingoldii]